MTPARLDPRALDERRRYWAYVSCFGAAWGAIEITLGSFLHTLRLPLAGSLMACLGATLLIAQRQVLPARGATLATGIIAALCKSLSPGGAILGPMVGITVEALLVEVVLLAAPRALASAVLAGLAAATWAATQKLLSQYVFYGGDLVALLFEAVRKGAATLQLRERWVWWTMAAVLLAPVSLGVVAGVTGRRLGAACRLRVGREGGGA